MKMKANLGKGWSSHNIILLKVLQNSNGDVLELGAGPFSTPLLHWVCKDMGRKLITYDGNEQYYNFAKQFQSKLHSIRFVTDWEKDVRLNDVGVVFVDHDGISPDGKWLGSMRGGSAIKFKDLADYIVLHDTESEETYNYGNVWKHFKNRYNWKECRPWTSVVSNRRDLDFLNKSF
jgi:hypothetical protein